MSKTPRRDRVHEFWTAMIFALGIAFVCFGGAIVASTFRSGPSAESRTPTLAEARMVLPTH
jgi:hypothetical protein